MTRRTAALGAALGLAIATMAQVATQAPTGAADAARRTSTAADRALTRLRADTSGRVRVARGAGGTARVVHVAGADDPAVARTMSPQQAARAHLTRYGGLLGVADPGTGLVARGTARSVTGHDIVRFSEVRGGLPVIGGSVAVDVRPDRQLGSLTASVSRATVPVATVGAPAARRAALDVTRKRLGSGTAELSAAAPVHELYDPAVLGVPRTSDPATHARGVWSVDVQAGPAFRRRVLVDDRSGAVVLDLDANEEIDRVVCDDANAPDTTDVPCTSGFARTESSGPSDVQDVNDAFELAGVVSAFYHRIGGIDLTQLLGVDEGDHRSLSSTVRFCDFLTAQTQCPLQNAFWNGVAMFYGDGYAGADDVVGHEMTHGVISHSSDLFYWGQSGAINESLADVMGEIIDHRHHTAGESAHSWLLGEDLPGGAIRSMRKPGSFGQPDSMTSRLYLRGTFDNGGVHINSGVGNRTFYLISQGGRQGGVTVHGIDGSSLARSATLYLDVIQHLVSGSDYADLAAVLDHSCRDLARHRTVGMTAADCRNVHRATVATRLRTTPPRAKQPPDAPMTCPRGTGPVRVLFDSESGSPAGKVDAGSTWVRAPSSTVFPPVPANATSGRGSWFSSEPISVRRSSLRLHPVALPARHPAFLWFQQWRLLESSRRFDGVLVNFDGGTVEVADLTRGKGPRPAEGLPWVNGPRGLLDGEFGNPAAGRLAFSGDSRGYLASRLSLSRYAGHAASPQLTMNTDNNSTELGWYVDDVRLYSCGRGPMPRSTPRIVGSPVVGGLLGADPGRWTSRARTSVHWYAGGRAVAGATGATYRVRRGDVGKRISVKVVATSRGRHTATFSPATDIVSG